MDVGADLVLARCDGALQRGSLIRLATRIEHALETQDSAFLHSCSLGTRFVLSADFTDLRGLFFDSSAVLGSQDAWLATTSRSIRRMAAPERRLSRASSNPARKSSA